MANTNNMRRTHSSPGVYFNETELTYSSKSLGITTLGVAGETLKGPAFQPITIESWRQFLNYFGGTSTEKYRGSQYPKYELPYIAKSYLEQSQQLEVVRVLGLSGVNAGPAWVITATKNKLGEGTVYTKLTYAPTDVDPNYWKDCGVDKNTYDIDEELPSCITDSNEESPDFYRQVFSYLKEKTTCPEDETQIKRIYDTLNEMYLDTTIKEGTVAVKNGRYYKELPSEPADHDEWVEGINDFCDLPQFFNNPITTSPEYLRIGCGCGFVELDNDPYSSNPSNWHSEGDWQNWFGDDTYKNGHYPCPGEENNPKTPIKISKPEYKKVVYPELLDEIDATQTTTNEGNIVINQSDNVIYVWGGDGYVLYNNERKTIAELTEPIVYHCITYTFISDGTTKYYWDGNQYKSFDDSDLSQNKTYISEYITLSEPENLTTPNVSTADIYQWDAENVVYKEHVTYNYSASYDEDHPMPQIVYDSAVYSVYYLYTNSCNEVICYIIEQNDSFYDYQNVYTYYQNEQAYECYEVTPVYNYYVKETITVQTSEQDTECCEENLNTIVAVLRSRGEHKKAKFVRTPNAQDRANGICNDIYEYDGIEYYAKSVELTASNSLVLGDDCTPGYSASSGDFSVDSTNYGRFTIVVTDIEGVEHRYSVSLNPNDNNYIYNVIGGNPEDGDAEVYVEELYDVALRQMIEDGQVNAINGELLYYPEVYIRPSIPSVDDILTESLPKKNMLGKRYLYSPSVLEGLYVTYIGESGEEPVIAPARAGYIYTVEKHNGNYVYVCHCVSYNGGDIIDSSKTEKIVLFDYQTQVNDSNEFTNCVKVLKDDMFYIVLNDSEQNPDVYPITFDMNNYREPFRYSSTPWIISEIKGDAENVELTKLFRFHTISDGSNSLGEVKISIENIDPETGTFDVLIRDFNDIDYSPSVLEKYGKCDLVHGSKNYIAYRIGSFDGTYETKSKYVTVEVNENDITEVSTPAGFMGYPIRDYSGVGITPEMPFTPKKPWFKYNTSIDDEVRAKKQYFGVSDLVGIDTDVLKYKGVEAYNGLPTGLTACFHLDARILNGTPDEDGVITAFGDIQQKVTIDGVGGYSWVTVGMNNVTEYSIEPRIGDEATMRGTIYEDKKYRKFTVAMYGGWDGWDYYRTSRSNTNDFTYANYRGALNKTSGFGNVVNVLKEPEVFGLDEGSKCLNTDYYAYLGAIKQFANPRTIEINVLATPGIDYVNNGLLVDDVIEMVEEERADALYVVTTPDKPFGAGDSQSEMYSVEDAVYNLEDSDIDTNRACTYYPWEKYYDDTNYQYIFLPITRDVVKSIAYTDNITYPWYAPAGWNRGSISGVAPKKKLKVSETDTLYDGRINYVNSFAKEGDKIWGNKNLQVAESQMNRISTRRLLLRIKKLCDKACIGFVFDPNDASMAKSLDSALRNILNNIKSNRGIYDFNIEIDDSVEARDRLELPATIYIKPTKLVEYILITAVVSPEGMSWTN